MRIERIGNATLYCADSLDVIPQLDKVDLVITDPPYGIQSIVGGYGRSHRTIENDENLDVCKQVMAACAKAVNSGYMLAFYSARVSPDFHDHDLAMEYHGEIIWDKKAPGMGAGIRYQHENIAIYKTANAPKHSNIFSVISVFRQGKVHPHEKPVELMKMLVDRFPGETILDPFMGSGSTGVAAVQMGRKFIGIELDPEHFETACQRMHEAQKQIDLFIGNDCFAGACQMDLLG